MTREEEITMAANNYCIDARLGYPRIMDDTDKMIHKAYLEGVSWADQHPRKGLWDAEKVCKVLKDYMFKERFFDNRITRTAMIDNVVCNLIKAMED